MLRSWPLAHDPAAAPSVCRHTHSHLSQFNRPPFPDSLRSPTVEELCNSDDDSTHRPRQGWESGTHTWPNMATWQRRNNGGGEQSTSLWHTVRRMPPRGGNVRSRSRNDRWLITVTITTGKAEPTIRRLLGGYEKACLATLATSRRKSGTVAPWQDATGRRDDGGLL